MNETWSLLSPTPYLKVVSILAAFDPSKHVKINKIWLKIASFDQATCQHPVISQNHRKRSPVTGRLLVHFSRQKIL